MQNEILKDLYLKAANSGLISAAEGDREAELTTIEYLRKALSLSLDKNRERADILRRTAAALGRYSRRTDYEAQEEALLMYSECISIYNRLNFIQEANDTYGDMGIIYEERISGDRAENLRKALLCYEAALPFRENSSHQSYLQLCLNYANAMFAVWESGESIDVDRIVEKYKLVIRSEIDIGINADIYAELQLARITMRKYRLSLKNSQESSNFQNIEIPVKEAISGVLRSHQIINNITLTAVQAIEELEELGRESIDYHDFAKETLCAISKDAQSCGSAEIYAACMVGRAWCEMLPPYPLELNEQRCKKAIDFLGSAARASSNLSDFKQMSIEVLYALCLSEYTIYRPKLLEHVIRIFASILESARSNANKYFEAVSLHALGVLFRDRINGEFAQNLTHAQNFLNEALAQARAMGSEGLAQMIELNLNSLAFDAMPVEPNSRAASIFESYQEQKKLDRGVRDKSVSDLLNDGAALCDMAKEAGDPRSYLKKAEEAYREASEREGARSNLHLTAKVKANQCALYSTWSILLDEDRFDEALDFGRQSYRCALETRNSHLIGLCAANYGHAIYHSDRQELGYQNDLSQVLLSALDCFEKTRSHQAFEALRILQKCALHLGDVDKLENYLNRQLQMRGRLFSETVSEDLMATLSHQSRELVGQVALMHVLKDNREKALLAIESGRAIDLGYYANERRAVASGVKSSNSVGFRDLKQLKSKFTTISGNCDPYEILNWENEISVMEAKISEGKNMDSNPRVDATILDVLNSVPRGGALVHIAQSPRGALVFVTAFVEGAKHIHALLIDEITTELIDQVAKVWRAVQIQLSTELAKANSNLGEVFRAYYKANGALEELLQASSSTLIGVIVSLLEAMDVEKEADIVLVLNGSFASLPLHAAKDPKGNSLIDQYSVSYLPSTLAILQPKKMGKFEKLVAEDQRRRNEPWFSATIFKDFKKQALHDTESNEQDDVQELRNLIRKLGGNLSVCDSSELHENFVDFANYNFCHSDVLIFDCHGQYNDKLPTRSGLHLSSDVFLSVSSIATLPYFSKNPLVFLSACEVGLPDFNIVPDEYRSVTSAFLGLGASSVFSPAWLVEESIAKYILEQVLAEMGVDDQVLSPAQVLRKVTLLLKSTGSTETRELSENERLLGMPIIWANFVHTGNPDVFKTVLASGGNHQ